MNIGSRTTKDFLSFCVSTHGFTLAVSVKCLNAIFSPFQTFSYIYRVWHSNLQSLINWNYRHNPYRNSCSGYPYQSPTVKFMTPCFHPNVDTHGNICLDILKENWSAAYEVKTSVSLFNS